MALCERACLPLAGKGSGWHRGGMAKTASAPRKATASDGVARKRKSAAQKFRELPEAERRRRINAFIDENDAYWKDRPSTGSVDFLVKMRRGK